VFHAATDRVHRGPTCAMCHMPDRNHNVSLGIAHELDGGPLGKDESDVKRANMVSQCTRCHSKRFVEDAFKTTDSILRQAIEIRDKAKRVVERAHADALVGIGEIGPELGPNMTCPPDAPALLREFFQLRNRCFATTWKAAYHDSPVYVHTHGWEPLNQSCQAILDEAKRLREQKR
jgi:hypothetical protein